MKKYKNDFGISLLEVIFALGIMASLTPVVVKFAFKDLSDIKYLNLAKKIKQLTKSVVAYSAKTRNDWANDTTGIITKEQLDSLHLGDNVVDNQILNKSHIKYIKNNSGEVNVYGVVDLDEYSLDPDKFKKTLLYVENNIGYVVDDVCGSCVRSPCVCSINNDRAISYNDISSEHTDKIENKLLAVVRVDENLLRKDYLKDFYLYRNSQGGDTGNVMQRDLSVGGHNLQDIVALFTQSLSGENTDPELNKFKAIKGNFFDNISVTDAFIFDKELVLNFLNNSIVEAFNIYFQQPVIFKNFSASNAILKKDPNSRKSQTIQAENVIFAGDNSNFSMSVDDIITDEVTKMDNVIVNGELATINAPHIQMEPTTILKTKIFNVNNKLKIGENDKIILDAGTGQIQMGTGSSLIINNIHGRTKNVNYFDKVTGTKTLFENLKTEMQTKFKKI